MTSVAGEAAPLGGAMRPGKRRPGLTRDQVLSAALAIIDRDGVEALTMRCPGQALNRNPMAIYRHATDKDILLDGVVELVVSGFVIPVAPGIAPASRSPSSPGCVHWPPNLPLRRSRRTRRRTCHRGCRTTQPAAQFRIDHVGREMARRDYGVRRLPAR
jgi:AcrR family transcriptional regulator